MGCKRAEFDVVLTNFRTCTILNNVASVRKLVLINHSFLSYMVVKIVIFFFFTFFLLGVKYFR